MSQRNAKVLFVLTSHDRMGDTGKKTGAYLPEVTQPWQVFVKAGFDVDFVSPQGGKPPLDGVDRKDPTVAAFLDDEAAMAKLERSAVPAAIDPSAYRAIFYAGGHGTMWDLPDHAGLARITTAIFEAGGVVSAVCHGPVGLVNVKLSDGSYLIAGKEVAAFTNDEERAMKLAEVVPFLLVDKLVERGARHRAAADWKPLTVVDGRLVTGQNPASAVGVAEAVVKLLQGGPAA